MGYMRNLIITCLLSCICAISFGQDKFPSLTVKDMQGKSVATEDILQDGKVKVFSFWATWCAPCKKELDAISEVYEDWQDEYNMDLYAVSVDNARAIAKIKPMVASKNWPFEILIDANQDFMRNLQFQSIPFTCLVDGEGNIVYKHSGYIPGDEFELEDEIAKLNQ